MIIFDSEYMNEKNARPRIKVIGVGGAGGNAIHTLASQDLHGVECIALNTDAQALTHVKVPHKIQLGSKQVRGMGTGSNPEIGRQAAEEDIQKINEMVKDADIVFLLAGLGGGTGSGALPVVARILQEREILSIALVTKPFSFEGTRRINIADAALLKLEECVDSLIVIPNQKLFDTSESADTPLMVAFEKINKVIADCIKAVADTINNPGHINVDFADMKATMTRMGKAVMGIGRSSGENRAQEAIHSAITSKLLEHTSLKGARSILLNISGGDSLSLQEVGTIAAYVHEQAHQDAHIILGSGVDKALGDELVVTLIATGFEDYMKVRSVPKQVPYSHNPSSGRSAHGTFVNHDFNNHIQQVAAQSFSSAQNPQQQTNSIEIPALLRKLMAEQNMSSENK